MKFLNAEISDLVEIFNYVRHEAIQNGFKNSDVKKIELAVEEAVVNIIHHSYKDLNGFLEIGCSFKDDALTIMIIDNAMPFNPLDFYKSQQNSPKNQSLEHHNLGGKGLILIYEIMDKVDYRRTNNQNVLTLMKLKRS